MKRRVARRGASFAARVIRWQQRHGRHGLPWQGMRDPYRVWLSEIMLQQTQVATVIPYYERFVARFPDVAALARADLDAVLALWSGLGYYARARNLHAAARQVLERHAGRFPEERNALEALPGVGRSTAAAVAVFAFGRREAILDANVQRVLARHAAVPGFPGDRDVRERLWRIAESLLPRRGLEAYTQGLMDLGAAVCTRRRPACGTCPVTDDCVAARKGETASFPQPRARAPVPLRRSSMLLLHHDGRVLLEKRPPAGVWGGLLCLPELPEGEDAAAYCRRRFGLRLEAVRRLPPLHHGFTHFDLDIQPVLCEVAGPALQAQEGGLAWLTADDARRAALPAPVRRLLESVREPALFEHAAQDGQARERVVQL